MRMHRWFDSKNTKIFLLSLIPLIILISIQFLVTAQVTESDDQTRSGSLKIDNADSLEISVDDIDISQDFIFEQTGTASYYAKRFHNRRTASGVRFDMHKFTAAHRKLPFGTIIKVTNLDNNLSTLVQVNDRGPHLRRRILDLSKAAANAISGLGLPKVRIEGFLPGDLDFSVFSAKNYFFGYSEQRAPVCIPGKSISLIDSLNLFEDALAALRKLQTRRNDKNTFIFIKAGVESNNDLTYYIGQLKKTRASDNYSYSFTKKVF